MDSIFHNDIGVVVVHLGDYVKAKECFRRAFNIQPMNVRFRILYCACLFKKERYGEIYESTDNFIKADRLL